MDFGGSSVPGPRPYNEDDYLVKDVSESAAALGGLLAFVLVSDGMGGHSSGDVASRVTVEAAESYVDDLLAMGRESHLKVDPRLALREIVAEAHTAITSAAQERGASSMGATFVAAFLSDRHAWIGHVGDSRAYLLRDGEASQLTVDHSQVGRMIAEGILTEEQAQNHPQRNVIERALGFDGAEPEIDEVKLHPGDVLVLCSDGLSTVLTGLDMVHIAAAAANAEDAARRLTEEAVRVGTDDNATAVVISDDWPLFRMSAPQARTSRRATSQARRQAAKHRHAQRWSWIAAGVVAVCAIVVALFALSGPKASLVAPVGDGLKSSQSTATPDVSTNTTAPSRPDNGLKYEANAIVKRTEPWVNLRDKPSVKAKVVARVKGGTRILVETEQARTDRTGKMWYPVVLAYLGQLPADAVPSNPNLRSRTEPLWIRADLTE
jgi:serine/threonine protein phosphatase PrpC